MIKLISPNYKSDDFVFCWQQNEKVATEENKYIVNTIYLVTQDVDELKDDKSLLYMIRNVDLKSYSSVKELSDNYNKRLTSIKEEWLKNKMTPAFLNQKSSKKMLQHVIDYCYNKAVDEPDKLNQYAPFSAEVYGETSFELVDQIIEWVKFEVDDVFIDLGSGVGQVVLQVAAATQCKSCIGIEKADYPAKCAHIIETEFKKLMNFFGKPYNPFSLTKGDFLADEFQETISNSSVIFANNFAFGPVVDHQLKDRFTSLREGAKIISSKAFCPLKFRITDRNLDDIGSIMRVTRISEMKDAVSWTCSPFSYYLHQVDHSMLEEYFAKYKQKFKPDSDSVTSNGQTPNDCCTREHTPLSRSNSKSTIASSHNTTNSRVKSKPKLKQSSGSVSVTRSSLSSKSRHRNMLQESIGRRASGRLLRNCRRYSNINNNHHSNTTDLSASSQLTEEEMEQDQLMKTSLSKRGRPKRRASDANRSLSKSSDNSVRVHSNQGSISSSNRSHSNNRHMQHTNINQLHQATMSRIGTHNTAQPSINGTGHMSKYASEYKPLEFPTLKDAVEFCSVSNDNINLCHSNDVVPVAIHQYLELVKHRMMRHLNLMRSSEYKDQIRAEISRQLTLRCQLHASIAELENLQIPQLHANGVKLLTQHLKQLGINKVRSPSEFFTEARQLIRQQAQYEDENAEIRLEVNDLLAKQRKLKEQIRNCDFQQSLLHKQPQINGGNSTQNNYFPIQPQPHNNSANSTLEQLIRGATNIMASTDNRVYSPISRSNSPVLTNSNIYMEA